VACQSAWDPLYARAKGSGQFQDALAWLEAQPSHRGEEGGATNANFFGRVAPPNSRKRPIRLTLLAARLCTECSNNRGGGPTGWGLLHQAAWWRADRQTLVQLRALGETSPRCESAFLQRSKRRSHCLQRSKRRWGVGSGGEGCHTAAAHTACSVSVLRGS
jgi:hypothetical protein